ncbi:Transposable element P transposase [Aphis craccivora]|uniref:Transposable element P transposase n=1 Tax=Aphis craccivora TaxID=307492 RepID=A0A6G0Z879_APHCR|nr:Transposable element P transposase [Aphis craccivora]
MITMLSKEQKPGILLVDEIILHEVLIYVGFENFGNKIHASNTKANHGLVFMFQSWSINFCQPVAIFTSIGTVKDIILAQLIIKAISLLENSGVKVEGVSGSINNVKNSFQNPIDERRSIYVFSDVPHLMKNIRNRLNNKTTLKVHPDRPHVSHITKRYHKIPTVVPTRVCPIITEIHLKLDIFSKMTVKLATRVPIIIYK